MPRVRLLLVALAVAWPGTGCRVPAREGQSGLRDAALPDAGAQASTDDGWASVEAAGEPFVVRTWSFGAAATTFTLVDLAMRGSLLDALGQEGRVAVNAGFFDLEGEPLGFAASGERVLSRYSATMSGGVYYVTRGAAHVVATEDFDPTTPVSFAVQCRPRLVVHGHANVKRDDGQRAARTALCVRDDGQTVDIVLAEPASGTRGPSLFALGQYLADQRRCDDALNLDGGPSTGVAYRPGPPGSAPVSRPPRGPLRYAIVVRDRE